MSERTEEPTQRKLDKEREQGNVPLSRDFNSVLLLAFSLGVILWQGPPLLRRLAQVTAVCLQHAVEGPPQPPLAMLAAACAQVAPPVLAVLVVLLALGIVVSFVQIGPVAAVDPMLPKPERLNPVEGLKRMFGKAQAWFEIAKSIVKVLAVGGACQAILRWRLPDVLATSELEPVAAVSLVFTVVVQMGLASVGALIGIVIADMVFQRWNWRQNLKMSKDEVRREYKENEGSPELRAERRRRHRELAEAAMLAAVRDADVVTINPTHIACALRYDPDEEEVPRLVAKGQGRLAKRIRDVARIHRIPIVRRREFARALFHLRLGSEIPAVLYEAAQVVLLWAESALVAAGRQARWRQKLEQRAAAAPTTGAPVAAHDRPDRSQRRW